MSVRVWTKHSKHNRNQTKPDEFIKAQQNKAKKNKNEKNNEDVKSEENR